MKTVSIEVIFFKENGDQNSHTLLWKGPGIYGLMDYEHGSVTGTGSTGRIGSPGHSLQIPNSWLEDTLSKSPNKSGTPIIEIWSQEVDRVIYSLYWEGRGWYRTSTDDGKTRKVGESSSPVGSLKLEGFSGHTRPGLYEFASEWLLSRFVKMGMDYSDSITEAG